MNVELVLWVVFHVVVGAMLAVDLGVFQRTPHKMSIREATIWSVVWIGAALLFNAGVWVLEGPQAGLEWLTAYLVEKALSVDNLFVFLVIFSYFAVPDYLQPRVLLWGVLGAGLLGAGLLAVGVTLVEPSHRVLYFFGAVLVSAGWKLFRSRPDVRRPFFATRAIGRGFPGLKRLVPDFHNIPSALSLGVLAPVLVPAPARPPRSAG